MKIEKIKIKQNPDDFKKYKIKHFKKMVGFLFTFLLLLVVGYFQQNESFQIMHIFFYKTPIVYISVLILLIMIIFCSTSSIVINKERLTFILAELFDIKLFSSIDFDKIKSVDYSKRWTLFGFNWLEIIDNSEKKILIPLDIYENKENLTENLINSINKNDKVLMNKEQFYTLLDKKHSLQFKNIFILTLASLFLYAGLVISLKSNPQIKLNINESLLNFSKVFDSNNPEIYIKLGELYIQEAQYQKATVVLKKAIKLNPNNDVALYYYGIANIYLLNVNDAIDSLSKSLKLKPDNLQYISSLSYAYSLNNDKNNALKYADIVFNKGSKNDHDYILISNVYFKYNQIKKGFICLIKARDLSKPKIKTKTN